ncbi:hypothetical protein E2C01_022840 [Portunus trituberculatus]|uniref:Uncharacterized protein n=1 Tax=Portunus trituberculatus TaxID=210409 RepID=A0A5B7E861_PORTR|nr:hypothetical protein [Portunus trituberculatus]
MDSVMPPASLHTAPPSPPIRPAGQQGSAEVLQAWRGGSQPPHGYTSQASSMQVLHLAVCRRDNILGDAVTDSGTAHPTPAEEKRNVHHPLDITLFINGRKSKHKDI